MSDLTTASTSFAAIVVAAGVALSLIIWQASTRLGDPRLRFIAAGFGILAVKNIVSIYTIQVPKLHHEVTEFIGAVFDVAMVACLAAPLLMSRRL